MTQGYENFIGIGIVAVLIVIVVSVFLRFVPIGLWITAYFSGVNDAAFSVTETAGPWDGPAYWLNALVRSLTRPIKRRIGIAARVLL